MPVNDRYPLADVLAECERYFALRRRKVFIEYVMLAGVNDRVEQAASSPRCSTRGLQGEPDPVQPDGDVRRLDAQARSTRSSRCSTARACPATVRLTRGRDIDAACGQLAAAS